MIKAPAEPARAGPWRVGGGVGQHPFTATLLVVMVFLFGFVVVSEQLLDWVEQQYGRRARRILVKWDELIQDYRDRNDMEKLEAVNRFFNRRIRFVDDIRHWHQQDYWATPLETMVTFGGDCEDFAVAKYFTLRAMGVPDDKLRLVYVRAKRLRQAHMVLAFYPAPNADPLILDNITTRIRRGSDRTDLVPVYSFNGSYLWMSRGRLTGTLAGPADRLAKWRDLKQRIGRLPGWQANDGSSYLG